MALRSSIGARLVVEELAPLEPGHGEQPLGRQLGNNLGHADARLVGEDGAVKPRVARLEIVVELLAQARGDLLQDLAGRDRGIHARVHGEHGLELVKVGLDGRRHVGVLQLRRQQTAVVRHRLVHLAERGRRRGLRVEALKARHPVGAQLDGHAPLGEGGAHGRRRRLQLRQLARVLGRQRLGDGGQELRHLHQRALEAAESGGEVGRGAGSVVLAPEQALAGDARRDRADVGADAHVARGPR